MGLEKREKERIAARARTLRDQLRTPANEGTESHFEQPDDLLGEWKERVADGDDDAFSNRLDISGFSKDVCRRRLATADWPREEPLPEWIAHLENLLEYVERIDPADVEFDSSEDDVPFAHLLSAFVEYASEQIDWEAQLEECSPQAISDLEEGLLDRLYNLCAHSLFVEFKTFVASYDEELAFADDPAALTSSDEYYKSFVRNQFDGDLKLFFEEYAVLSKSVVTIVRQWVQTVREFGSRLSADRAALRKTFGSETELGPVAEITLLGDPHRGGRRVLGVTFDSGTKIAYKPRSIDPEIGFFGFLDWMNATSDLPDLLTLTGLSREDYGWIEWVEPEDCSNRTDVSTYYQRAGMLLCLLYVLRFTDGHLENIVAVGDHPVLVDLETLLHPTPKPEKSIIGNEITAELIFDSVLQTGLLPVHYPDSDVQNVGGFGAVEGKQVGLEIPEFENVNTDAMELEYRDEHTLEGENLPTLDGEPIAPGNHADAIADGFERLYRFLLSHREEILREGGPLEAFDDVESRLIVRPTSTYGKVLFPLTTPKFLRSGAQFGCRVETLAKSFATEDVDDELWPVYESERESMWRFDVPRFTVNATSTDIRHADRTIRDGIDVPPFDQVARRIERLDEADLREQLDYVDLAYASRSLSRPRPESSLPGGVTDVDRVDGLAERKPREIFARVRDNAKWTTGGDVTWYHREYRVNGAYVHRTLDSLYEGRVGIALFTAALANVTGEESYRAFTHEVLSPLIDELDDEETFADVKLGAAGIGSLGYGFTKIAELLDDDDFVSHAREAVSHLTTERIRDDTELDLVGGSAGAVLGLLPLYEQSGDREVLDRAVTAGERLLSTRVEADGVPVWKTLEDDPPQVGNLHGIAGIAHALVRLADATGERRFRDAALESLEYERQKFSPERKNWPDLQSSTDADFSTDWRAGRAGVGLSRLGMYEIAPEESLEREFELALDGFDFETLAERDSLVDGNFGRVEFLLRAGRTLDEPTYERRAEQLANAAVRRAEREGRFTVPWQTARWYNPAFFVGESGIGYALLRLAHEELPCVLLWE